jgi:hypothetical protein
MYSTRHNEYKPIKGILTSRLERQLRYCSGSWRACILLLFSLFCVTTGQLAAQPTGMQCTQLVVPKWHVFLRGEIAEDMLEMTTRHLCFLGFNGAK